jgi:hypothetical protein
MRKHQTFAYKDGYKWITYCVKCSLEEGALDLEPVCVGRYVSPLTEEKIKKMEERLDTLKTVF